MAQQRQLLMSLNTRYYTKFAAEDPRQIRISANEIMVINFILDQPRSHWISARP